ncbi:MAG: hypothetical protein IJA10_14120 [Lachnospiraceae bacterium]|nr:hypothetical protein [Lachnospiraceae bacterium]
MKQNKNYFTSFAGVFLIFGIVMAIFSWDTILYSFYEPVDIYEEGYDFVEAGKGGHIDTTLFASLDAAASLTTTSSRRGRTTSSTTNYYYIVPVYDADDNEYYVCVEVNEHDTTPYDALVDATWDYLSDETAEEIEHPGIKFTGTAKKLDDEVYEYMKDWFEEAEWFESDADIDEYVLQISLEEKNFAGRNVMIIVLVVLFGLAILFFILGRKRDKKLEAQEEAFRQQVQVINNDEVYINLPIGSYPRSELARVDAFLSGGEKVQAIAALRDITGCGLAEAKEIVDNWFKYYI